MISAFSDDIRGRFETFLYRNMCISEQYIESCTIDLLNSFGFIQAGIAIVNQYKDIMQNYYESPDDIYPSDKYKYSSNS